MDRLWIMKIPFLAHVNLYLNPTVLLLGNALILISCGSSILINLQLPRYPFRPYRTFPAYQIRILSRCGQNLSIQSLQVYPS